MASKKKPSKSTGTKRAKVTFPSDQLLALAQELARLNGKVSAEAASSKKIEFNGVKYTFTPKLKKSMDAFANRLGDDGPKVVATVKAYFSGKGKNPTTKADLLAKHGTTPKTVKIDKQGAIKVFCVGTWAYGEGYEGKEVSVYYYSDRIEVKLQ